MSATGAVALLNYAYTLILLWMLPTREFAEAGSISALLLICGTIAGAALPWVLAQEVLRSGPDRARRRLAVSFCLFATVLQGAGAGLATCLIVMHYARGWVLPASFAAVFMIFMGATATGFFQGQQRFRLIAVLKIGRGGRQDRHRGGAHRPRRGGQRGHRRLRPRRHGGGGGRGGGHGPGHPVVLVGVRRSPPVGQHPGPDGHPGGGGRPGQHGRGHREPGPRDLAGTGHLPGRQHLRPDPRVHRIGAVDRGVPPDDRRPASPAGGGAGEHGPVRHAVRARRRGRRHHAAGLVRGPVPEPVRRRGGHPPVVGARGPGHGIGQPHHHLLPGDRPLPADDRAPQLRGGPLRRPGGVRPPDSAVSSAWRWPSPSGARVGGRGPPPGGHPAVAGSPAGHLATLPGGGGGLPAPGPAPPPRRGLEPLGARLRTRLLPAVAAAPDRRGRRRRVRPTPAAPPRLRGPEAARGRGRVGPDPRDQPPAGRRLRHHRGVRPVPGGAGPGWRTGCATCTSGCPAPTSPSGSPTSPGCRWPCSATRPIW